MTKMKVVIAVGIIALFLGLSISPATATFTETQNDLRELRDALQTNAMTKNQETVLQQFLPILSEKMQAATSYQNLLDTLRDMMGDWAKYPVAMLLLKMVMKLITWNNQFNKFRPVRQTAFILSWGFAHGLLPSRENRLNLQRPFTMWYYAGKGNLLNSRTIIIDFSPFTIKTLTGRQLGFMNHFIGLYVYRHSTLMDNSFTFMLGHGRIIRGFDLSPFAC